MDRCKKIWLVGIMIAGIMLTGCRPKGILHSGELRDLLVDLHKADALFQVAGLQYGNDEARQIYYAQVLEKHGVTQAQFDSTLVWYTAHPQYFDKIYPKVMDELRQEEARFVAQHEDELNLRPLENGLLASDSITPRPFTHAQLDSTLWTALHGYSHAWNEMPLMQDTVNQFFPQIGVLR